jgi:hypothetical protein
MVQKTVRNTPQFPLHLYNILCMFGTLFQQINNMFQMTYQNGDVPHIQSFVF